MRFIASGGLATGPGAGIPEVASPGAGVGAGLEPDALAPVAIGGADVTGGVDPGAVCGPGEKCIIVRVAGDTMPAGAVGIGAGVFALAPGVAGNVEAAAAGVKAPHCPQNLARSGSE